MKIAREVKQELKKQRLLQLQRRYFDLEMTRISYEAVGNIKDAELVAQRMDEVKKAYEAIEAIDISQ